MCHGCKPGLLSSERLPLRRGAVDRDRRGPWSPAKRTRWSGAGAPCDVQLFRNKASLIAMKCEIGTLWETCRDNGPRTAMHAVQLGSIARHNTVCLLHPYCIVFKNRGSQEWQTLPLVGLCGEALPSSGSITGQRLSLHGGCWPGHLQH